MENLFFLGSHKTASRWLLKNTLDISRILCIQNFISWGSNVEKINFNKQKKIVCLLNANLNSLEKLSEENKNQSKFVLIVRDFRDQIVSGYFSHKNSHPRSNDRLSNHIDILQSVDQEKGLMEEIKFFKHRFNNIKTFIKIKESDLNFEIIKFDDFTSNYLEIYPRLLREIGFEIRNRKTYIPINLRLLFYKVCYFLAKQFNIYFNLKRIDHEMLNYILQKNSFKQLKALSSNAKKMKNHYRKGVSGDWKNYFNREHCELFNNLYGDLLTDFGFEKDNKWIENIN